MVAAAGMIAVGLEITPRKAFATALEWPGWSRAGRDEAGALAALAAYAGRYASAARSAGDRVSEITAAEPLVVERAAGSAATAFGVPGVIFRADARPTSAADGELLAALARASWAALEHVAASAPSELRKGPRGGGRDRDAIFAHVITAETAYAHQMGIRLPEPDPGDARAVAAVRAAICDSLARPTDGAPVPGGRWPARYAARRIAWHVLDHAWEIEDRTDPA
jgi:hypothetical protein